MIYLSGEELDGNSQVEQRQPIENLPGDVF